MEYLALLNKQSLTDVQSAVVGDLMYTVKDVERISDHCDNIVDLAQELAEEKMQFSMDAREGLKEITQLSVDAIESTIEARRTKKMQECRECIQRVVQLENEIDHLRDELRHQHMERLNRNECSAAKGIIYLDILSNMERISDHSLNVVNYIADELSA